MNWLRKNAWKIGVYFAVMIAARPLGAALEMVIPFLKPDPGDYFAGAAAMTAMILLWPGIYGLRRAST